MAEARYDAVADFYTAAFGTIDDPATAVMLDLLGSPAGLSVLDIACGHGRVTRELARRGPAITTKDDGAPTPRCPRYAIRSARTIAWVHLPQRLPPARPVAR